MYFLIPFLVQYEKYVKDETRSICPPSREKSKSSNFNNIVLLFASIIFVFFTLRVNLLSVYQSKIRLQSLQDLVFLEWCRCSINQNSIIIRLFSTVVGKLLI